MAVCLDLSHLAPVKSNKSRTIAIPAFNRYPELVHGFSTRYGGVSNAEFATLNLNFYRGDNPENVHENFRRIASDLDVGLADLILSKQTHGNRMLVVDNTHKGMGITRDRTYDGIDAIATSEPGLMLVTYYADCVPLYFYDPEKKVIALAHSGWKGTLLDIAARSVEQLEASFNCDPADIQVAFGPHIGRCCFEVGEEVSDQFFDTFAWARESAEKNANGKWMLDLEAIITQSLTGTGINPENIHGNRICTRCEMDTFFSHRGSHGKTGTGIAFLMMKG